MPSQPLCLRVSTDKIALSLRRIRSLQMAVFRRAERKEKGNEGEMISFRARRSKSSSFCLTLCAPCSILFGLDTPHKSLTLKIRSLFSLWS